MAWSNSGIPIPGQKILLNYFCLTARAYICATLFMAMPLNCGSPFFFFLIFSKKIINKFTDFRGSVFQSDDYHTFWKLLIHFTDEQSCLHLIRCWRTDLKNKMSYSHLIKVCTFPDEQQHCWTVLLAGLLDCWRPRMQGERVFMDPVSVNAHGSSPGCHQPLRLPLPHISGPVALILLLWSIHYFQASHALRLCVYAFMGGVENAGSAMQHASRILAV